MALIFQLFSLTDLKRLSASQLEHLRAFVGAQQRTLTPEVMIALWPLLSAEYRLLTGHDPSCGLSPHATNQSLLGQMLHSDDLEELDHKDYTLLQWALECALEHHPEVVAALSRDVRRLYTSLSGEAPHGPELPRIDRTARSV
jgi:hypothetical protein